jgi:aminopeptidase N
MVKGVLGAGKAKMTERLGAVPEQVNSKSEIYLKDYQPPGFEVEGIELLFQLSGDDAVVTAITRFQRVKPGEQSLLLDGGPFMGLLLVELDGKPLTPEEYEQTATSLLIKNVPDVFTLKVQTALKPIENTRLEGLYKSSGTFCTQCEAEGFRHITYFLDRPDVMTRYKVRIEADRDDYPVLLSNGNLIETGYLANGRHFAEWYDPFPKPSYLFAMVAGNLTCLKDEYVTRSGKAVTLNIYAAAQDIAKCDHAMQSLKNSMRWDEDTFGLEYDLDIYNIVAVSDFNMGAMENKGLNIFNTKYVLASPETATDQDYNNVEGVIAHEYFHNWTGNRVTCRDWFQLSLKEGLTVFRDQEFSSDMQSRAVKRLDDVRVLRMHQFPEDAGPLAHPVRPEKYIEINNFYSATVYNKGAEVIRMMHTILGADAFRRGMDIYFNRHDGQAVTCEDFVLAMEAASGIDLSQFRRWYSTAGTPKLCFERYREGDDIILKVKQSIDIRSAQENHEQPLHVPIQIGWIDPETGEGIKQVDRQSIDAANAKQIGQASGLLHLTEAEETFRFPNMPKGAVPSLMRGFSAPVHIEHDLSPDELLALTVYDVDPFVRAEAMQHMGRSMILSAANAEDDHTEVAISDSYVETFGNLLSDTKTDEALLAELISLPSEIDIGQHMSPLEPERLHRLRENVLDQLGNKFSQQIIERYHHIVEANVAASPKGQAGRRLKNILLGYIARTDDGAEIVGKQFDNASNMTDQIAALSLIASSDFMFRETALNSFFEQWKEEALVVDKWFSVQALSKRADAVSRVHNLLKHQHFSYVNPNRLRSLISSFSILNQAKFHQNDGEGYELLGDVVVKVDSINPQTAARLVAPLGQWKRLDATRQLKMQSILEKMLVKDNLSNDVRELVEKSLN